MRFRGIGITLASAISQWKGSDLGRDIMKLSSDRAAGVGTKLDSVVVPLDHTKQ